MKLKKGFMLLEIAVGLLMTTFFWGVIIKTILEISVWHGLLRKDIQAIDYASSYCEALRTGANIGFIPNGLELEFKKINIADTGRWNIILSDQERKKLSILMNCCYIAVSWKDHGGKKRSHIIFVGWSRYSNIEGL